MTPTPAPAPTTPTPAPVAVALEPSQVVREAYLRTLSRLPDDRLKRTFEFERQLANVDAIFDRVLA